MFDFPEPLSRDEIQSLKLAVLERVVPSRPDVDECEIPDDELTDLDMLFISDPETVDGIEPCKTFPSTRSFCNGFGHYRRSYLVSSGMWSWVVYEFCPRLEERKRAYREGVPQSKWRGACGA